MMRKAEIRDRLESALASVEVDIDERNLTAIKPGDAFAYALGGLEQRIRNLLAEL